MYSRLLSLPTDSSVFLFGPRGTGKTTWVREKFPEALYFDLLNAQTSRDFLIDPTRLEKAIPNGFTNWVIIDEIQKIPELLDEVHRLIENKHHKFILTGSSARKLRRSGTNLLGGRASIFKMYPLTAVELGENYNLSEYLQFGGLPAALSSTDKNNYLHGYIHSYLEQEVMQEGVSRNLGGFARFLETASFSQGSILNVTEVGREAAVGRKTAEAYFCALEDLLIGERLPVFTRKAKRKLVSHGKFYFFDAGIYQIIRPSGPLDQKEVIGGIVLESLFFQNLRAINGYLSLGYKLYFYRTLSGVEVDFVAYGNRGLVAIEVKSKKSLSSGDMYGLKSFINEYPMAKGVMVYGGSIKMYEKNIEIWPIRDALLHLPEILG